MNEYKGFKVGDKVEVIQQGLRIHYKIGEIGVVAELLTNGLLAVVFGERREVVRPDNIKKLPKYAVGDVVRRMGAISVVVKHEETPPYYLVDSADGKDSNWTLTSELSDFDGFRIGDTVWTVKRGKGKIFAQNSHDDRQFGVRWEIDAPLYTFPKTTNLIPTEAKYKEALNKAGYAFKIDVAYVQEYVAKPKNEAAERQAEKIAKIKAAGEAFYQAAKNMAAAIGRTTDQIKFPSGGVVYQCPPIPEHLIVSREPIMKFQVAPSAKFKVGDAVYHKGNKLFVKRNMISCPQMVEVGNSCAGYTTVVAESDLRLWKETVLTHCLQSDGVTWSDGGPNGWDTKWYLKIEPLPNYTNPALFKVTTKSGNECIFRGIKGDDIS